MTSTTSKEVVATFGFDPETVGLRFRGWYIAPDDEDGVCYIDSFGACSIPAGCLVVEARDGAFNEDDSEAYKKSNFYNTWENEFDSTYRYYAFTPLNSNELKESN